MDIPKFNGYYIFITHYTKNGVTYYAKDYGKRAFKIWVERK